MSLTVQLDEMMAFLTRRKNKDRAFTYELIIVDDGSKDRTAEIAMEYVNRYGDDTVRLCRLYKNCGKGGAVRKVCLCLCVLFALPSPSLSHFLVCFCVFVFG